MSRRRVKRAEPVVAAQHTDLQRLPVSILKTARPAPDRRGHDRGDFERRDHKRAAVEAVAFLGATGEDGCQGRLYDLSPAGCSLELATMAYEVGDQVWFRIDAVRPWKGTVRWVRDSRVGVEFDRPFFPAMFELIVQLNKPVTIAQAA